MVSLLDDTLVLVFGHEQSMLAGQYCSVMGGPWRSTWHSGGDFYGMPPSTSNMLFGSVSLVRVHLGWGQNIGIAFANLEGITNIRYESY